MKDGIIKGTGDSRYLKGAGWPSTYAEFKAMAEAGTLPFDLNGINEAGWQQIGDALNKANLLSDESSLKFYSSGNHTVNDALSIIGDVISGVSGSFIGGATSDLSPIIIPLGSLSFVPKFMLLFPVLFNEKYNFYQPYNIDIRRFKSAAKDGTDRFVLDATNSHFFYRSSLDPDDYSEIAFYGYTQNTSTEYFWLLI